jgi:predicted ATPase
MVEHEATEDASRQTILDKILDAFPGKDTTGHREYHQGKIDAAIAEKEYWEAAKKTLVSEGVKGVLSVLKILLYLALAGLAIKLGFAVPFMGGK